ncbi:rhodanese-like domain-containing protein [Flavisolibacter ginsengisoli]|jgi:rhodanese-related sulfurtransferase|uniref:Rhodanese-related sulfurtransferase n=1 Tax=Flavisolibacter ginsengisoli DSM 18119 TaxID=1121884 RepID=A0A1M4X3G3_9BACT|nr:rhodanese-like domain-containing protein [Flavisolibacter ginsengisoli]SHE87977.1 Rhodanese-related sulfurtransferase [Flavisolibacter ginsengisoli DSM 18119]
MKNITVEELKAKMEKGDAINLIDCREPHEYEEFNIGGKLVPLGKIQTMQIEDIEDLKEEEVIVHCRSGKRSMMACMILDQMGFKNTFNVEGGMLAWKEKFGEK